MFGYIYKTTNTINNKTYIGKRKGAFDANYFGSGVIISSAIEKYGLENFTVEVIVECDSLDSLNTAEMNFISELCPEYNIAKGGDGGDTLLYATPERKAEVFSLRSTKLKDMYSSLDETKRKDWSIAISNSKRGKPNGRTGSRHTSETIEKIRLSNIEKASVRDEAWYVNHAAAMAARKGISNTKCKKPVEINDIVYDGVCDAAKALSVSRRTIRNWIICGKAKYA